MAAGSFIRDLWTTFSVVQQCMSLLLVANVALVIVERILKTTWTQRPIFEAVLYLPLAWIPVEIAMRAYGIVECGLGCCWQPYQAMTPQFAQGLVLGAVVLTLTGVIELVRRRSAGMQWFGTTFALLALALDIVLVLSVSEFSRIE